MFKDLEKHAVTAAVVAVGVIAAGWAMYTFRTNTYVNDARKGFAGTA